MPVLPFNQAHLDFLKTDPKAALPQWLKFTNGQPCALMLMAMSALHQPGVLEELHDLLPFIGGLWSEHGWPDSGTPRDLWAHALRTLSSAYGVNLRKVAPHPPSGELGIVHRQTQSWLEAWALSSAQMGVMQDMSAVFGGDVPRVTMKVLLVEGIHSDETPAAARGHVAQLTLYRVHSPGALLALVPAPASAVLPCTSVFAGAMQTTTNWLRRVVRPSPTAHDLALAWTVSQPGGAITSLDGTSLGGALALAGAWLLRDLLDPQAELCAAIRRLSLDDLFNAHVSAALLEDGRLAPVGGLGAKRRALRQYMQAEPRPVQLLIAEGHAPGDFGADEQGRLLVRSCTSVIDLAGSARRSEPDLTDDQEAVWLLVQERQRNPDMSCRPHLELLRRVAESDARSFPQMLLQRWAWWEAWWGGELSTQFVRLCLAPEEEAMRQLSRKRRDAHKDQQKPDRRHQTSDQSIRKGLEDLLASTKEDLVVDGFMLRGKPGAGKTTLLQEYEQALCARALHRLHAGELTSAEPVEWPLYLPLAELPADRDVRVWIDDILKQRRVVLPREWRSLPGTDPLDDHALRAQGVTLRLMLDGLNEMPVTGMQTRNERAAQILQALRARLRPTLPALMCTRTHHPFTFEATRNARPLRVAPVDVLPWTEDDITEYIRRRFKDRKRKAREYIQALEGNPSLQALLGTPFNLVAQCKLWAAGYERLASNRADLYRRMLWAALQREVRDDRWIERNARLLTAKDREFIQSVDLGSESLPPWPKSCLLLESLFRQGLQQWWQAAERNPDLPAEQRGGVAVPWNDPDDHHRAERERRSVCHWLQDAQATDPDELREAWRGAVRDLGLLDDFQSVTDRGAPDITLAAQRLRWRHQTWGEYLASAGLLGETPEHMPAERLEDLKGILSKGRVFDCTDEEAIRRLGKDERLLLPGVGELDEVLGLALLGLNDPAPWLRWLIQNGLWAALYPSIPDLQVKLEGQDEAAWTSEAPNPVLQHLRRVLLLRSLDAGPAARKPVERSGQWALVFSQDSHCDPAMEDHWKRELSLAFRRHRSGQIGRDLRERILAARMLGALGDNLRYVRARAATGFGLRPKEGLWAGVGDPSGLTRHRIGAGIFDRAATNVEKPAIWTKPMAYFEISRLQVTVAEWRAFIWANGYHRRSDHWVQAGPAARMWLAGTLPRDGAKVNAPRAMLQECSDRFRALDPMHGLTTYEAVAYARWAQPMHSPLEAAAPSPLCEMWQLRVPSEIEWEAAMRVDCSGKPKWFFWPWPRRVDALQMNHSATRLRGVSPVGVFSRGYGFTGQVDALGNAFDFCTNLYPKSRFPVYKYWPEGALAPWTFDVKVRVRAIRGGSFETGVHWLRLTRRAGHRETHVGHPTVGVRLIRQPISVVSVEQGTQQK
jgi:formylglycine-generating enzyme required for sulfatase activity